MVAQLVVDAVNRIVHPAARQLVARVEEVAAGVAVTGCAVRAHRQVGLKADGVLDETEEAVAGSCPSRATEGAP